MYLIKNFRLRVLLIILLSFFMPTISSAIAETDVTARRVVAKVEGYQEGQEKANNIRIQFYDLRVDGDFFMHPSLRLKVSRRPGQSVQMDLILNSKLTRLSYDKRRNYGGGGSNYKGWKAWLNKNDQRKLSGFKSLVKRLPDLEQKALRGMCGYLADPSKLRDIFKKAKLDQVQTSLWPTNPRTKENKKLISEMTDLAEYCSKALANAAPKSVSVRLVSRTSTSKKIAVAKCNNSRLILKRGQTALADLGFYKSTIDGIWGPATEQAIVMGERLLASGKVAVSKVGTYNRASRTDQNKCLNINELAWLETLSEAPKSGFKCGTSRATLGDKNKFGPMLQDLGFIHKSTNLLEPFLSHSMERNLISGVIRFESSEYTPDPSKGFIRDCYLNNQEKVELERILANKNLKPIDLTPNGTTVPDTYTMQEAQNFFKDLESYISLNTNVFGPDLVVKYADAVQVYKSGKWGPEDKKAFTSLKDFTLKNSNFALYHATQAGIRNDKLAKGVQRLQGYLESLLADGLTFISINPLDNEAIKVKKVLDDIKSVQFRGNIPLLIEKISKVVQQFETFGVPFREIKIESDELYLTDDELEAVNTLKELFKKREFSISEVKKANSELLIEQDKAKRLELEEQKRLLELAEKNLLAQRIVDDAEQLRKEQEAKRKAQKKLEELQAKLAEEDAKTEAQKKKIKLYQKEGPTLVADIKEFVQSGEKFDIRLPRFIQSINGIGSTEWSDDLVSKYEALVSYVNQKNFEKFKQFRKDNAQKREQIKIKLRADLSSDIDRILAEMESWISENQFAPEAVDLLTAFEEFIAPEVGEEIETLESNLSDLLQKIEKTGVELPITELLDRRGYSLDGGNNPLGAVNVITTLSDAQQYIKDVKAFIEANPTVFGYNVISLFNSVRPIIENNSWSDEAKSNFSSFEEYTSKEKFFVTYRKDAINSRAKGRQVALQRVRSALVQLLADGTVYLQNNLTAENSINVFEVLEYGRQFERNTNPKDILRAVDKLKSEYSRYGVGFTDTLIAIEFLEMSEEEVLLLEKMNKETQLRNKKNKTLTDQIQTDIKKVEDARIAEEAAKVKAQLIEAEDKKIKAIDELEEKKRKLGEEATIYETRLDEFREEAKTLVLDAREYVRQGNQFSLEFVFLNAGIQGFDQDNWDQEIFNKYQKFRNYVLKFEPFSKFRTQQIKLRRGKLLEKRRLLEGEIKLSEESLLKWIIENQLHDRAAKAYGVYQEIEKLQNNIKDSVLDLGFLEKEVFGFSKRLIDLGLDGIYIPGIITLTPPILPIGTSTDEVFTLPDAQDLISDIQIYVKEGIGKFDNRFILLYGDTRGAQEGVWNASIEGAVSELKAYVLSFDQFSSFYQNQLEGRRQVLADQLISLAKETIASFELLSDWIGENTFDVRAPEMVKKMQATQVMIDRIKADPLVLDPEDLSSLKLDLSATLAKLGVVVVADIGSSGGSIGSKSKPVVALNSNKEGKIPTSKFVYANLSGGARNAYRNIDGQVKFENGKADYCYEMLKPFSKTERFYTNIALTKSNIPNLYVMERCSDVNISSIDLILTDGLALNEGNKTLQESIANGFEKIFEISQNDIEASIMKDELISDNLKTDILDEVRAGYGYIVFDNNSNIGCLTVAENLDAHNYFIQQTSERVSLSRKSLINNYENMSLENAFKQVQRERCGMIYSSAQHLQKLIKGLDNAKTSYNLAAEWYSSKDIRNKQEELENDKKTNSQEKLLKQRKFEDQKKLEALANEQARAEAQTIQASLRVQYGPRLKGLQSEFDSSILSLVDGLFMGKSVTSRFNGAFSFLDRNVRADIKKSWEEDDRELQLVDYGNGQWSGRRVEVLVSKLDIRMKNKILGKYKDLCFDLMYVWDEEFGVIRDPMATKCADGMLEQWLNKQGFESLWVRN